MSAGDEIMVKINEIVANGDGLARFGSKAVFVNRSCVGETIIVRIFKEQQTWARAEFHKIIGPVSPDRVESRCKYFGRCGGCTMQYIRYEAQLEAKVARFKDKFSHVAGFHPPEPRVVASRPWEYRNFLRLVIKKDPRRAPALGFVNFRGDEFVPVSDCPIADPQIRSMLGDTAKNKSLLLPPNTDEYIMYSRDGLFLTDMSKRLGATTILDKEIVVDVNAHIPNNVSLTEQLVTELIDIADTADHSRPMADLYCGIGTFSSFLADSFPGADLTDKNRKALALAKINVTAKHSRFLGISDRSWARVANPPPGYYGFMVIDPPPVQRLPPGTLEWLIHGGPPVLAYCSQDTSTFAQDAGELCRAGYRLTRVTIYDFCPHTGFTDTLAVLERD